MRSISNHLACGPVMHERATLPYRYVLRHLEGDPCPYVVHTEQVDHFGNHVAYFWGNYFRERDKAALFWAKKVHDKIAHNVENLVEF